MSLRDDAERYGDGRHPALPWGYWLTSIGDVPGEPPLVDEEGRTYASVRQAFWFGRLGLPKHFHMDRILEFILCFLAVADARFVGKEEQIRDVFIGDRYLHEFFGAWLEAMGLFSSLNQRPTSEGRAAVLMLIATRTTQDSRNDVGLDWIRAHRSMASPADRRNAEDMVRRNEATASRMAHRFAVAEINGLPAVKLIGLRITPEIPVRSTVWSMCWPDRDSHARDRFYLWLLERIDRWDDWNEIVAQHGSRALTELLMRLAFCERFATTIGVDADNV